MSGYFLINYVSHSHSDQISQAQLMKIMANNGMTNGIYGYNLMMNVVAMHSRDFRCSEAFLTLNLHYIYKIMESTR